MALVRENLTIYGGRDYSKTFAALTSTGAIADLTDISFKAEIREEQSQSSTLLATFIIVVDLTTGYVTISLTDTITLAITGKFCYWDMVMRIESTDYPVILGTVTIDDTVTEV